MLALTRIASPLSRHAIRSSVGRFQLPAVATASFDDHHHNPSSWQTTPLGQASLGSTRTVVVPFMAVPRKQLYREAMKPRRLRKKKISRRWEPTKEEVMTLPLSPQELDNSALIVLAGIGDHASRKEVVKRHIMDVDKVSYMEACAIFDNEIVPKNKEYMYLLSLPYSAGITLGVTSAFLAIPMVFHLGTASWFNEVHVTTDIPEPRDLETFWEVGAWTWNWMEPPLGTISFVLLALQFSRAQLQNLGLKPYTAKVKQWRAERLSKAFPRFNSTVLQRYSKSSSLYDP